MTADASPTPPLIPIDLAHEADFWLGAIRVRPSIRQVEAGGEAETLEPRILQVLVALSRRVGQVVSRDDLIATCWDGRVVGEDAINRCISRLRKLGSAHQAFEIETIPRVGYRLAAADSDAAPAPSIPTPRPDPAGVEQGEPPSLAVLPFVNRSGLAEDEVFADGMMEDVIEVLSSFPQWRVLSSSVTGNLRKRGEPDLPAVGRQYGVTYILDGNVRRTGEDLRVTAQLIEAAGGAIIWSGRFERPLSQLAALQEDLVVEVSGAIGMQIHVAEIQRTLKKPDNLSAWECCTRAMAAMRGSDPMSMMKAVEEAGRAVAIAPDYPYAAGILAAASSLVYFLFTPDNPAEVQRIRGLAERALAIGQDSAFVLVNAAGALTNIGFPQEALAPLERAKRKAPRLGPVYYVGAGTYLFLDRIDEALAALDEAERLMPAPYMIAYINEWRAAALIRAGRWSEAEEAVDRAIAINPMQLLTVIMKSALCWLRQDRKQARQLMAPIRAMGFLQLQQLETFYGRIYANSARREEMLSALRALWAETAA